MTAWKGELEIRGKPLVSPPEALVGRLGLAEEPGSNAEWSGEGGMA